MTTLKGEAIKSLNRLRVGKDGDLYVCDFDPKRVSQFDPEGNYTRSFGKQGNEPGGHLFPSSVVETVDSSIAISDFQGHRVNLFSKDGSFRDSFIYTPQNFSAQDLIFNEANDSFYLLGNRWQKNETGEVTGADLIHKYSSKGNYLASFLQFPDKFKSLDLYNFSFPATDVSDGSIYLVLPFDYTVYRLTEKDELSVFLKGDISNFKAPQTKLDASKVAPADAYKFVQSWLLNWTPIVSLAVSGDDLLIQYQTFSPLRYTIDIWSTSTKKFKRTINSNFLMLNRGLDNKFYFLKNLETKNQAKYEVIRAQIK